MKTDCCRRKAETWSDAERERSRGLIWFRKVRNMNKVIITVVGKDTVGIIAKVCTYLAENKVNILDISQTIVQEYFNMMMIADMEHAAASFDAVAAGLDKIGEEIGVKIKCQREEIFTKMHRI